ncbi:MAG: hypothetical protein M1455_06405 [Actinobacteria bacterium]|nr:hypothetical protein [Actinomycetota bacterium]
MAKTTWFHNPESGQTFEVELGTVWEEEARSRGYEEIDGPEGAPPAKADDTDGQVTGDQKGEEEGTTDENAEADSESSSSANDAEVETPAKADAKAKGGKEKK